MIRQIRLQIKLPAFIKRQLWILRLRRRGRFADSDWFSLMFRPFLEKDYARLWVGGPMMLLAISLGAVHSPRDVQTSLALTKPTPVNLLTVDVVLPKSSDELRYLLPVEAMLGLSQTFHPGHRGVDIMAEMYAPITVVDGGIVDEVVYSGVGYGNHVYIRHDDNLRTLYAHMQQIYVTKGQSLTAGTIIGTVGVSGRSTGPHLHFEVEHKGAKIDPMLLIEKALQRQYANAVLH